MKQPLGTVYLLHFSTPFGHAKHYTGWATNLAARLNHHAKGTGANLLKHAAAAGITWTVARTWEGKTKSFERSLKNRGGASRVCPLCKGA